MTKVAKEQLRENIARAINERDSIWKRYCSALLQYRDAPRSDRWLYSDHMTQAARELRDNESRINSLTYQLT